MSRRVPHIMTALKPTDIDDLTAFGAGTHGHPSVKNTDIGTVIGLGWNNQAQKMTNMLTLKKHVSLPSTPLDHFLTTALRANYRQSTLSLPHHA